MASQFPMWCDPMTQDDKVFFKQLGARIAQLRKERGLTQARLAEAISVSQQHMASFESGIRKLPLSAVGPLTEALNVTFDDLIGQMAEKGEAKPKMKRGPAPKLQQQMEAISLLPKQQQRFVMQMLETVLSQADKD